MKSNHDSFRWRVANSIWFLIQHIFPAKVYLSLRYRVVFGHWINWSEPKKFSEKLQWLKLYGYGASESHLVDKLLVKDFVAERIGEEFVLPTLGMWSKASEIAFANLPDEYVIKCNHDSGSVFLSKKYQPLNQKDVISVFEKELKTNYYWTGSETPYKYVTPKVFAEPLIKCSTEEGLMDYKFFCFNGEPKLFKIDFDRFTDHRANYYDVDGNLLPFGEISFPPMYEKRLQLPENLQEMLDVARSLSRGLPFARVDLYNIEGIIIFGEITLFPASGFGRFTDDHWDLRLGDWINLPSRSK